MCRKMQTIITEAPHLCIPRTNSPIQTSFVRCVIEP